MNKEQQKLLVEAWELNHKIISQIKDLAYMNEGLAYGCIRHAETLVDYITICKFRRLEDDIRAKESVKEGNDV